MTKFTNKYIEIYADNYEKVKIDKEILTDAIIYSKYYLYYKTKNCIYSEEIMNILYDIENNM
jgi:hypothetical protein